MVLQYNFTRSELFTYSFQKKFQKNPKSPPIPNSISPFPSPKTPTQPNTTSRPSRPTHRKSLCDIPNVKTNFLNNTKRTVIEVTIQGGIFRSRLACDIQGYNLQTIIRYWSSQITVSGFIFIESPLTTLSPKQIVVPYISQITFLINLDNLLRHPSINLDSLKQPTDYL